MQLSCQNLQFSLHSLQKACQKLPKRVLERMSKDEQRCDSLQFSLHNLQISLSRYSRIGSF